MTKKTFNDLKDTTGLFEYINLLEKTVKGIDKQVGKGWTHGRATDKLDKIWELNRPAINEVIAKNKSNN